MPRLLAVGLVPLEVVDGGPDLLARLLPGADRVDRVPHHQQGLERHHDLVVLHEVAHQHQDLLDRHESSFDVPLTDSLSPKARRGRGGRDGRHRHGQVRSGWRAWNGDRELRVLSRDQTSTAVKARSSRQNGDALASALGGEGFLDLRNQRREVSRHDFPQDVEVDEVVPVDQAIPGADGLPPRKLRVPALKIRRYSARGFADDLHEPGQSSCSSRSLSRSSRRIDLAPGRPLALAWSSMCRKHERTLRLIAGALRTRSRK